MTIGILLTLAGSAIVALYRVLIRKVMNRGAAEEDRPVESVLNAATSICATAALLVAFVASGAHADIQPTFWRAVAVSGALNVAISAFAFQALKREQASLVVPIFDTTPVAIVFVAMLVTGEMPTPVGYLGIALLVLGTYTLNIQALIDELKQRWSLRAFFAPFLALRRSVGVRFAFLAALLGCVAISFDGVAARSGDPLLAMACIVGVSAVGHLVRASTGGHAAQFLERRRGMPWAGFLGVLFGIAVGMYAWSFRFLLVAYQATVKRTETFFLLVLAWAILRERKHFAARLVAVVLLVAGTTLIAWQR